MKIISNKLKDIVSFFKQELNGLYDERELRSIIFIIMEEFTGYSSSQLLTNEDHTVSESTLLKINFAIKDLKEYKPLQYILGYATFYNLKLKVTSDVMIPRPETEELVKWVIDDNKYAREIKIENEPKNLKLVDIGTGSGCISIAIKNIPEISIKAIDISEHALKVAKKNAELNKVEINFFQHDIFDKNLYGFKFKIDIIVSNPPYVRESEKALMSPNVLDYEPELALFVKDEQALAYYEAIANFSLLRLKPKGHIYLEVNEALALETSEIFILKGFKKIKLRQDIHGKNRMLRISR